MLKKESVLIENLETLLQMMNTFELSVEWTISSNIGPGWIGSHRTISFYLDHLVLEDTPFHRQLQQTLIDLLGLPQQSKEYIIQGEGDISRQGKTIPYQYPLEKKFGKLVFLRCF